MSVQIFNPSLNGLLGVFVLLNVLRLIPYKMSGLQMFDSPLLVDSSLIVSLAVLKLLSRLESHGFSLAFVFSVTQTPFAHVDVFGCFPR